MAKQLINLGTPNGRDGDTVRVAFGKINDNFSELYVGLDLLNIATNVRPATSGLYDLGSVERVWHALWLSPEGVHIGASRLSINEQGAITVDGDVVATPNGDPVQADWSATSGPSQILNKPVLSAVATSNDYRQLSHKPTIPTLTSQLTNDAGFSTFSGSWTDLTNKPALFNGSYLSLTNRPTLFSGSYLDLVHKPTLFTGSYLDLTNKPSIPLDINQLTDVDSLLGAGGGVGATDRLTNGGYSAVLDEYGLLTIPNTIRAQDNNQLRFYSYDDSIKIRYYDATGSIQRSQVRLNDSNITIGAGSTYWSFDNNGTINTPLFFPKTFTALLLPVYGGAPNIGPYGGNAWEIGITFNDDGDGIVRVYADNIFPILNNPGYKTGDSWTFHEADHGIPGYTFTLTLGNVVYPGGAGWTANISTSEPPAYTPTIKSLGTVKITAGTESWTFDTNGKLTLPVGGDILNSNGDTVLGGGTGGGLSVSDFGRGFTNTLDSGKITTNKLYNRPSNLALNNHFELSVDDGGVVHLPDQSVINGATLKTVPGNYAGITAGPVGKDEDSWVYVDNDGAWIATKYSTDAFTWKFDNNGTLTVPGNIESGAGVGPVVIEANDGTARTWTFGGDGNTTFPNGIEFDGSEGNTFALISGAVSKIDLRDDGGRGFYTDNGGFNLRSNGSHTWQFGTDGYLNLPGDSARILGSDIGLILEGNGAPGSSNLTLLEAGAFLTSQADIRLTTAGGAGGDWTFGSNGVLTLAGVPNPNFFHDNGTVSYYPSSWMEMLSVGVSIGMGVFPNVIAAFRFNKSLYEFDFTQIKIGDAIAIDDVVAGYPVEPGTSSYQTVVTYSQQDPNDADLWIIGQNAYGGIAAEGTSVWLKLEPEATVLNAWSFNSNGQIGSGKNTLSLRANNSSWEFNNDGGLTFPDDTVQTTAYRQTTAPTTSVGSDGDLAGYVAFDNDYIYRCVANYDGTTDIWKRVALDATPWPVMHTLTVTVDGNGAVTSSPSGIIITGAGTTTHSYLSGTTITLSAAAASGSTFAGWAGPEGVSGTGTATVTMTSDISVTATFDLNSPPPPPPPPTQYTLSVHVEGSGTVTSSPGNISAMNGIDSSDVFDESTYVLLTASPDPGYDFVGWSGDFSSGSALTGVLMDNNYSVTATFENTPPPPPPPPPTLVSIDITPANSFVSTGNDTTVQFTATGTYSDGSTADLTNTVTWSSTYGNTNYSIDSTGLLRLLEGETYMTTITATLDSITSTTELSFG
jgi:hypothetical protein